jgi:TonB-linked SusC/RagA family outer membrane protein
MINFFDIKQQVMNKWLLLFFLMFLSSFMFESYAQRKISGVVQDVDKNPLLGVTVVVNGTSRAASTDLDGRYSIAASEGETLRFTYLGMNDHLAVVGKSETINVTMKSSELMIDEVVVTAMGVKTEKKKLNFSVQSVNSDELTNGRAANFITALQGKVAGVNVTSGGGSPNSGTQILLRGVSSINPAQNNEPLLVLDGVYYGKGASAASNINPNDIESVTILKGAAASALYGMDAANGVIMITTKQGVDGKVSVSANSSWQISDAVRIPKTQRIYGPGVEGFYKDEADIGGGGGWGPMLEAGTPTYNNVKNYFQRSYYQKNDISISGGSEKFQGLASVSFSRNDGIVKNDYLSKTGVLLKGSYKLSNQLNVSALANFTNDKYRGAGSTSSIYSWPITDDITNYADGIYPRFRYIDASNITDSPVSPLFSRNRDYGLNETQRSVIQATINYKPISKLDITGRWGLEKRDYTYDGYSVPRFDRESAEVVAQMSNFKQDVDKKGLLGNYAYNKSNSEIYSVNLMATFSQPLTKDIKLDLLAGGDIRVEKSIATTLSDAIFIIPGIYSIGNTERSDGVDVSTITHREIRRGGAYGEARLDYKGIANLSVTSRWDWTSTLKWKNLPIYYPSFTGGVIFSELFNLSNDWFSYGKLRGNIARVGKDAPSPYLYDRKYTQYSTLPDGGYGADPAKAVASEDLKPETSDSWEVGLEMRFFNNRTRFDAAYYSTKVSNQILTVRVSPSSGYILQVRNEGNIKNHGVELTLAQDIFKNRRFEWISTFNFGFNRGKVVGLPEETSEITGPQYTDIFTSAYLGNSTTALTGKDYNRTADGKIIVNANGYPSLSTIKNNVIGNREPDFLLGISNDFKYGNFTLNTLVDIRKGGDVANITGKGLWLSGMHRELEFYRGRQVVWDGVVAQPDGTYVKNTTPIVLDQTTLANSYSGVSSNFIEDGSYIRLSYVTLGYDFLKLLRKTSPVKGLKLALTGTNLLLLTKYTGADPQINANTSGGGTGSMGIDNYAVPNTRSFNFTITANF